MADPSWVAIRTRVLDALIAFPKARDTVIRALSDCERPSEPLAGIPAPVEGALISITHVYGV